MNAPTSPDTTAITVPPALWRIAAAFMHTLHALFGTPGDLAIKCTLTRKAHELTASWLRCGEALMRRLLLIEAQSFGKPGVRAPCRVSHKHMRKPAPAVTPEAPETWRVSFRCFAARQGRVSKQRLNARQQLAQIRRGLDAGDSFLHRAPRLLRSQALAERYEALLRAVDNPRAYARRLARRLYAAPQRAYHVLAAPPEARHRIDHYADISAAAETSAALFNSS